MKIETRKLGDSTGLVIPADVAARLGLVEGRPVYLTELKDGTLQITRFDPDAEESMALVDEVMTDFDEALRVLAR
ncbi:MAG: AbrB/MazE/SpoVT family DNA-binding domain-containing protein [Beijerinckiaceae bacterium]|nr:AbrB/MazE/SpoVT family DNA-binding domain-containing protein [Beijerinckiaceae bacterium]